MLDRETGRGEEFFQTLQATRLADMGPLLKQIGEAFEFDHFCCTAVTPLPSMGLDQQPGILTSLPQAFSDRYDHLNYIADDAIVDLWKKTASPIRWSDAEAAFSVRGPQARIFGEAREVRVQDGMSFSLRVSQRQFLGVSFARKAKALRSFSEAGELSLWRLTNAWMDRYVRQHDVCRQITLTRRQVQVLDGILRGWSNKEIANHIGKITEHCVKAHYEAIGKKLPNPSKSRFKIGSQAVRIGLAAKYGLH